MSKMPAKKKSCFQITSVTQAQVAASSITDDTESLDDESRTEDVSSEIFDVCRADLGVCERSSSEETLNSVTLGEPPDGQMPTTGPVNGGLCYKSIGTGRVTPHNVAGSVPVPATTQPFVPSPATHPPVTSTVSAASVAHTAPVNTTSCSSRFRVIKLDHGTGEPFRRGRWTCTEFYERDSDSNRTVDSIKPAVTLDHSTDRDSGLGATCNSVVISCTFSAQALENTSDSGYSVAHPAHSNHSEPLQQGYSLSPQIGNGASAFHPTGYPPTASQQAQTFLSNSLNGVHHGGPIMPPAMQAQQFAYSTPPGHSSGQQDYQQHFLSSTQNLPISALSMGPLTSQVSSPLIPPAGAGPKCQAERQQLSPGASDASRQYRKWPTTVCQPDSAYMRLGLPLPSVLTSSYNSVQNAPATSGPSTGGLVKPQGVHRGATTGLPSIFSNHVEDSRQKSDGLPQRSAIVMPGKDGVIPFLTDGFNLPNPAVNSLFGLHITMDVDEDRNPSTAFYQAFRPSRLRGSKPVNDRKFGETENMRCIMTYRLPCSPVTSPTYSGRLVPYRARSASSSGASVVAIDNKIEQAMDLVKSHLMYAVREEVEVLKEQIKELYERNSMLERENAVLKSLANTDQLGQLSSQLNTAGSTTPPLQQQHPLVTNNNNNNNPLAHHDASQSILSSPTSPRRDPISPTEEEAGEAVHTIKLHTVLVQEDGVKRHGERFVGATSDRRGRCSAVMRLQQGLSSQYPQPNITHGLEEATEPTEKRGRRFVLPERGGSRRVLRLHILWDVLYVSRLLCLLCRRLLSSGDSVSFSVA
ncbi:hypothetical protein F7725_027761 [Dissostichus mawsoni]|uniref:TSC22 domain family protein 2 n=1 Tax=Dissostichus mawsoni TaxID=36200 RepID=A0A7J5XEB8_DISMA|nr:hypothetical protein F7725_027761 [Dissostichus mawsoni]